MVRDRHRGGPGTPNPHDFGAHALRQGVHRNALSGSARGRPTRRTLGRGFPARARLRGRRERIGLEVSIIQRYCLMGPLFMPYLFYLLIPFLVFWFGVLAVLARALSPVGIIGIRVGQAPRMVIRRWTRGSRRLSGAARTPLN